MNYFPKKGNFKITNVGKYSISKPDDAKIVSLSIISILKNNDLVITDGTAGMGGNVFSFAQYFKHVNAVEFLPEHCDVLKHNIAEMKLTNVDVYCEDYTQFYTKLTQDVIFIDPPWGGPDYKQYRSLNLFLSNININSLVRDFMHHCRLCVIKVPYNFNYTGLIRAMPDGYMTSIYNVPRRNWKLVMVSKN